MTTVSGRLRQRITRDFPEPGSAEEVIRLLAEASESERIQAAILFAGHGDIREVQRQAELAKIDWRDVLLNGELAQDDWAAVLDSKLGPDETHSSAAFRALPRVDLLTSARASGDEQTGNFDLTRIRVGWTIQPQSGQVAGSPLSGVPMRTIPPPLASAVTGNVHRVNRWVESLTAL
jgi:hypothetical protein